MAEALGGGASGYFANNYYQGEGKAPGRWYGQGAKQLSLQFGLNHPEIQTEQWTNIFNGFAPNDSTQKLVQNAGKNSIKEVYVTRQGRPGERERKPGWDISFDSPKSVSVLWSQSSPEERKGLERAHRAAVNVATNYLIEKVGFTRAGRGGTKIIPAHPLIAVFEHYDSRANDPQLHSHTVFLNITIDDQNQTRSLRNSHPLYTHQLSAFALYRAELARQLSWNLGYKLEPHTSTQIEAFEIQGVPQTLITQFSKRGQGIKQELERRGFAGQPVEGKFSKLISLELRPPKREIPLKELISRWQQEAQFSGFKPQQIARSPQNPAQLKAAVPNLIRQVVEEALEKLTTANNTFSQLQFERAVFERAVAHNLGHYAVAPSHELLSEIEVRANTLGLPQSQRIVSVGERQGKMQYTTRGMVKLEQDLLSSARQIAQSSTLPVQVETVRDEIARSEALGVPLDAEQQAAVWYLTTSTQGLKVLTGWAGTGKTRIFETVQRIVTASGGRTLGMALAGKAAEELERKSGVQSYTVHKTVHSLEHQSQGLNVPLDDKTVVLLDEASMVSLRLAQRAFVQIEAAQANLIVIGDDKQLPAVEAGGVLKALKAEFGGVELQDIKRQPDRAQQQLVYDIAEGSPSSVERAVQYLAQNGLLVLEGTRQHALESMLQDWQVFGGLTRPEATQMIAMTNAEVNVLNESAQLERWFAQQIGEHSLKINDQYFHEEDRIVFRPTQQGERPQFSRYGVRNGAFGTIKAIDLEKAQMTVQLEGSGKRVTLPESFRDICLGYAATTHVMQGSDTERALILIGGTMQTHQQSYVQMSRHTLGLTLYTDRDTAGRDLSDLMRQMTRDGSKQFASVLLGRELSEDLSRAFNSPVAKTESHEQNGLQSAWEALASNEHWHEDPALQDMWRDDVTQAQVLEATWAEIEALIEQGNMPFTLEDFMDEVVAQASEEDRAEVANCRGEGSPEETAIKGSSEMELEVEEAVEQSQELTC